MYYGLTPSFGGMATCRGGRRRASKAATSSPAVFDRSTGKQLSLATCTRPDARNSEFTEREGALSLAEGTDTQEVSVDKTLDVVRNRSRAVLANSQNDDEAKRPVKA